MAGISNGGYLTRWQLENNPQLFDGGLDWEGTLFRAEGPNLLTFLPTALKHYPAYAATGDPAAHDAIIGAGFAPGSEFLWPFHHAYYWDLTQRIYREELDPALGRRARRRRSRSAPAGRRPATPTTTTPRARSR